jgi:hypothetical protein
MTTTVYYATGCQLVDVRGGTIIPANLHPKSKIKLPGNFGIFEV